MDSILKDNNNSNYIKKISAYEQYKDKNINNDLISFYYQFNHLKDIYRQGWIKNLLGKEHIEELDKLECIMQASCYGLDISYMETSKDNITLPYLKEILIELESLTNGNDMPLNIKRNK